MSDAAPSRIDDFLDVYIAPSKLFERRRDGKFGLALLVLVILVALLFFATRTAMAPIFDAEMARSMASSGQTVTPEQAEAMKQFGGIAFGASIIIGTPIGVLLLGLVIFLVAKLMAQGMTYVQGATIATFAMFPRLVEYIVSAVQALLLDESQLISRHSVSLGVGRLLDPVTASPVVLALLGRIDVFTIWVTILIAIGLKVMARATTAQAVAGAAIVWLVGSLPTLLPALAQ
jgi:hypothetical protein